MVRGSVLNDALKRMYNAEKRGRVLLSSLSCNQQRGHLHQSPVMSCNQGETLYDFLQNLNGTYGLSGVDSVGGGASRYADVSGQGSTTGNYSGNYNNLQQNSYGGQAQYSGMPQYNSPSNYTGNYCGSSGMYHGTTGISNGHNNVGGYEQSLSSGYGLSTGFYQQTTNEPHYGNVGTPGETSVTSNEQLVEAADGNQINGTLEDLDKFSEEGQLKEALQVLGLLEAKRIPVDLARYLLLMGACGEHRALEEAKAVHEHLLRSGVRLDVKTYNKVLEMYGRCGSMDDAFTVFNKMPRRNLTSWDIMISWLSKNGRGEDAVDLFTQFKEAGLKPDGKLFFAVFSACSILGDPVEGLLHFESMSKDFGIVPSMEHYVSVVDMLGSTGHVAEALEFIKKMPVDPSAEVWETLMNLSGIHQENASESFGMEEMLSLLG